MVDKEDVNTEWDLQDIWGLVIYEAFIWKKADNNWSHTDLTNSVIGFFFYLLKYHFTLETQITLFYLHLFQVEIHKIDIELKSLMTIQLRFT